MSRARLKIHLYGRLVGRWTNDLVLVRVPTIAPFMEPSYTWRLSLGAAGCVRMLVCCKRPPIYW